MKEAKVIFVTIFINLGYNYLFLFPFRYATYVFSGFKKDVNWDINGTIRYSDPCNGCSRCYNKDDNNDSSGSRWWHVFIPRTTYAQTEPDYSRVKNEKCGQLIEVPVVTTELTLVTGNVRDTVKTGPPALKLDFGKRKNNN